MRRLGAKVNSRWLGFQRIDDALGEGGWEVERHERRGVELRTKSERQIVMMKNVLPGQPKKKGNRGLYPTCKRKNPPEIIWKIGVVS